MQHLSVVHLKESCRRAIQEGSLGALVDRSSDGGRYLYEDGSKCAIGCALDLSTLTTILKAENGMGFYMSVFDLLAHCHVSVEDEAFTKSLQSVHDMWAKRAEGWEEFRGRFLQMVEWTGPIPEESP